MLIYFRFPKFFTTPKSVLGLWYIPIFFYQKDQVFLGLESNEFYTKKFNIDDKFFFDFVL